MTFVNFLNQYGVLTGTKNIHEKRRVKELARVIYKRLGKKADGMFRLTDDELKAIHDATLLSRRLYSLDSRSVEHIPYRSASYGMANVLQHAIVHGYPLQFLSFASNAIQVSSGKLKEKKQYERPNQLIKRIEKVMLGSNLSWTYEVFLADNDYAIPREKYSLLWSQNLDKLRNSCTMPARFLSELFDKTSISKIKSEIEVLHAGVIQDEALAYENNRSLMISFKTNLERNIYQMFQYATLGIYIERTMPTCIVLDIQKQMYPYEQPYFDRFRLAPLPLFWCFRQQKD